MLNEPFSLLDGAFRQPREGRNDDQAHPPIHPVSWVNPSALETDEQRRVYELVARHFLACCSEDAKGESSTVDIKYGDEIFGAHGLIVLERNYLDVYPYDKWESSRQLPQLTMGETFVPKEAKMREGKTGPPGYMTEPELLALMEANGIGTDATMAEHIAKIKQRNYVMTQSRSGLVTTEDDDESPQPARATRGGGRGRGGRDGRAGAQGSGGRSSGSSVPVFIPTTLGVALIEGYESVGFETSLSKPFLRKEVWTRWRLSAYGFVTNGSADGDKTEGYLRRCEG